MKNKLLVAFLVVLTAVPVFAQKQTLKIASIAPARSAWDVSQKKLAQEWAKASGNSISMQFMGTNAMGGESGVIQKLNSVRPGQKAPIDGAIFTSLGIAELVPDAHIMTLAVPFMFRSQDEVDYILKEFNPRFQKAVTNKGYMILGWFNVGWAYFFTKKPVNTLDDLKKQRLSVSGLGLSSLSNAFKAAGFTTVEIATDKLLQSMRQAGGVEGVYSIPMYAYAAQYYKSLPNILNVPICPVMTAFIISEKSWEAIPANIKPALLEAMKEAEKDFVANQKASDAEYLQHCVEGGCTLVTPTAEELRNMEQTLNRDASAMIKTGLMDQKLYDDIMESLRRYRGE